MNSTQEILSKVNLKEFDASDIFCDKQNNFLGRGGFGIVLSGYHCKDERQKCAIKCSALQGSATAISTNHEKIINEARMLVLAKHEHVLEVYGILTWGKWIGVVMEFMEWGSLHDLLFNEAINYIPLLLCLRMCKEIAEAVSHMHKILENHRIAHGDLKPDNILLTADLHCKVADFGGAALSRYTMSTNVVPDNPGQGVDRTWLFCAPERLDATRLSTSMDVFSFGVIIYVILTRRYPKYLFPTHFEMQFIEQIKSDLAKNSCKQDLEIFVLLEDVMKESSHDNPATRPSMPSSLIRLNSLLHRFGQSEISQSVEIVISKLTRPLVRFDEANLIPINQAMWQHEGYEFSSDKLMPMPVHKPANLPVKEHYVHSPSSPIRGQGPEELKIKDMVTSMQPTGNLVFDDRINAILHMIQGNNISDATTATQEFLEQLGSLTILPEDVSIYGDALIVLAEEFIKANSVISSLKLLHYVTLMSQNSSLAEKKLHLLNSCAYDTDRVLKNLSYTLNVKHVVTTQIIPLIKVIQNFLSSLCNIDRILLIKSEAMCLQCMAFCYNLIEDIDTADDLYRRAISILTTSSEGHRKVYVYGDCCGMLGGNYCRVGRKQDGEKLILEAFYALHNAEDFLTNEEKLISVSAAITDLGNLYVGNREMIGGNTKELYQFLKTSTGSSRVHNIVYSLAALVFAVLLNSKEATDLQGNVMVMLKNIKFSDEVRRCVVSLIRLVVTSLIQQKNSSAATKLLKQGVSLCSSICDGNIKVDCLFMLGHYLYDGAMSVISKHKADFSSLTQIMEENVQEISDFQNAAKFVKLKYLTWALYFQSKCYMALGSFSKALKLTKESIKLLPQMNIGTDGLYPNKVHQFYYSIGVAYFKLKNYSFSEKAYLRAIDIAVAEDHYSLNKSLLQLYRSNLNEARKMRKQEKHKQ